MISRIIITIGQDVLEDAKCFRPTFIKKNILDKNGEVHERADKIDNIWTLDIETSEETLFGPLLEA